MKKVTSTKQSVTRLNTDKLEELKKQLALAKGSYCKVGLLGRDSSRPPEAGKITDNPSLGAVHELGSASAKPPVPRRSFLKEPLISHLPTQIQARGAEAWRKAILEKGVLFALQLLGVEAENVVQQGFRSGGFGQWAPLSPYTLKKKARLGRSLNILQERVIMRKAIHSAVVKK